MVGRAIFKHFLCSRSSVPTMMVLRWQHPSFRNNLYQLISSITEPPSSGKKDDSPYCQSSSFDTASAVDNDTDIISCDRIIIEEKAGSSRCGMPGRLEQLLWDDAEAFNAAAKQSTAASAIKSKAAVIDPVIEEL